MPLHDYQCSSCGHVIKDRWTPTIEASIPLCDQCGQLMQMVYTSFEPRFKGPGFYETDYKRRENGGDKRSSSE